MRSPSFRLSHSSPYRWALGAHDVSPGQTIANRYIVISTHVWRDTQPGAATLDIFTADGDIADDSLGPLRQQLMPYYRLQGLRHAAVQIHLPVLHAVVTLDDRPVLLLQGILDRVGRPHPTLHSVWKRASSVQQLTWLWQLCPLWEALQAEGVASSLLTVDNLRVDGDRLCLMTLEADASPPPLSALGRLWLPWTIYTGALAAPLQAIAHQLQTAAAPESLYAAEYQLNRHLLHMTARPMAVEVTPGAAMAGDKSQMGPVSSGNTDGLPLAAVCSAADEEAGRSSSPPQPLPQEILQSLTIQVKAMGLELDRCGLLSPRWVVPQILAMVRVLNNVLIAQDSTARLSLAFALSIPQPLSADAERRLDAVSYDVYVFTIGTASVYQMHQHGWRHLTPSTPAASFLGESSDRLRGQLHRIVVEEDQLLLLRSHPLEDEVKSLPRIGIEHLQSDATEVASFTERIIDSAASEHSAAIALLHHQRTSASSETAEPASAQPSATNPEHSKRPQSIGQPSETAAAATAQAAAPSDAQLSELGFRSKLAPVEPLPEPLADPNSPEPDIHTAASTGRYDIPSPPRLLDSDFDEETDTGDYPADLSSGLSVVKPHLDDSIGHYIDAEVRPPQPVSNTILNQDIDRGLSTLVSAQNVKSSSRQGLRRRSHAGSAGTTSSQAKRSPSRPTPKTPVGSRRRPPVRRSRRRGLSGLGVILALLLALGAGVVGAAIWQQYYPEGLEQWLPLRQRSGEN